VVVSEALYVSRLDANATAGYAFMGPRPSPEGGAPPYRYHRGAAAPPWLEVDAVDGRASGVLPADLAPEEGPVEVAVVYACEDANGATTPVPLRLTVYPELKLLAGYQHTSVGAPYTRLRRGIYVGGYGALRFVALPGTAPPPGIALDPVSGDVLGVAEETGIFIFDMAAQDELGSTLTLTRFIFDVSPRLVVEWADFEAPATVPLGEPILFSLTAVNRTGGFGDLTYSLQDAPPGMALSLEARSLGASLRAGLFNVTVLAHDTYRGTAVVEQLVLEVLGPDCETAENGPNGLGCGAGRCLDGAPFDGAFTCDCTALGTAPVDENCLVPTDSRGEASGGAETNPFSYVAPILVGVLLLLLLLLLYWRRRKGDPDRSEPLDFEPLLQELATIGLVLDKVCTPRELDRKYVATLATLGHGQYGVVAKGLLSEPDSPDLPVAMKSIRDNLSLSARDHAEHNLIKEAAVHAQLHHPNVVRMVGVVTVGSPLVLVLELCEKGSLDTFLRERNSKISQLSLESKLNIAHNVASGIAYLHSKHFVHRDLAARNVLITATDVCKVGSLGAALGGREAPPVSPGRNGVALSPRSPRSPTLACHRRRTRGRTTFACQRAMRCALLPCLEWSAAVGWERSHLYFIYLLGSHSMDGHRGVGDGEV
jgi:LPXTG-motif cell wall-anchored protein